MNYSETIDYLFHAAPLFQNIGAGAYKEGLTTTRTLDAHFGHPHRRYRTIHVAGTNGKGSVSHTLAAILQCAGLRVGLYTSPHLLDFRERIRVNGVMIPQERVVDFVEHERSFFEPLHPSFFELTTALAFLYFAEQQVDVAVIEVGLGGRMDCTNIITPDLSVITNISFDHQQFLGDTLPLIAAEKAGIIKPQVPVVVGETGSDAAVRDVFLQKARELGSDIRFADEEPWVASSEPADDGGRTYALCDGSFLHGALGGDYQQHNLATVLAAVDALSQQPFYADLLRRHPRALRDGVEQVCSLTGFQGRWQKVHEAPLAVCDAGHNLAGITAVVNQLARLSCRRLHVVFGMVDDKDVRGALSEMRLLQDILPEVQFYFTQPSCARALPAERLAALATEILAPSSLPLLTLPSVPEAYSAALAASDSTDVIFIGGSCYVVADLLASLPK